MRLRVTAVLPGGRRREVLLDAEPDTPVAEVAAALARATGAGRGEGSGPQLWVGGLPCTGDQPLLGSPLREGAVVGLDTPEGAVLPEPFGLVELRVVSGPGAGAVHRLDAGSLALGTGPGSEIRLADPGLPAVALRVQVGLAGDCTVLPAPGGVVALLDGEPVQQAAPWPVGALLGVGAVLLERAEPSQPDAVLTPDDDGTLRLNRPPRLLPAARADRFTLPSPPVAPERRPLPWLVGLLPLVVAVPMAVLLHSPVYLALGLLTPLTALGTVLVDRRHGQVAHRRRLAEYRQQRDRVEAEVAEAVRAERAARRAAAPDPALVQLLAVGPRAGLWQRRRTDPDHLEVRVGSADLPSLVTVEGSPGDARPRSQHPVARDVPVVVPLGDCGVLGIAGPRARVLGGWVLAQTAALTSPADLSIAVLAEPASCSAWRWAGWLPHGRAGTGGAAAVVGDPESVAARVGELAALVAGRQAAGVDPQRGADRLREPDLLVVLDGAHRLRALPGVVTLLRDGPAVGVHLVCLDADERLLPEECQAVVLDEPGGLRVQRTGSEPVRGVRPDLVPESWLEQVGRALAPLRDPGADAQAALPGTVRLLDLLHLDQPTGAAVAARWSAGPAGRPRFIAGVSLDGPLELDLRRDGPHALIAGTTGSGKSELLQTLVAGLAVANRPDQVCFVLVDYKGGSAFKDCVRLPHTVGLVTDLDPHLVQRALASLSAELRRREQVLARAGVKDLDDYHAQPASVAGEPPLPRLVLVVDEFAALARDLPEFVTGLVGLAQRGRSLGMHLVLATQRPAGVVSAEIRANTALRIALRMADAAESSDVIDAADAARIGPATPGRACARLDHSRLVPFQAARVGGRRPGERRGRRAPWAAVLPDASLGGAPTPPARLPAEPPDTGWDRPGTDLAALVDAVRAAADLTGARAPASPWLAPLPARLTVDQLPAVPAPAGVGFGLLDLPEAQAQPPAVLDLHRFGHLLVAGAARSGRSQLLRTLAGALAAAHPVGAVHLYGLDCGDGALQAVAELPHCGAVVSRTEPERAARLLGRLAGELERRQQGPATSAAPHLVLLLDRWEGFLTSLAEADGGRLLDLVLQLLREGASAGIHLVLTGDRSVLAGRVAASCEDILALRLADHGDYALLGLNPRTVPEALPPGRAVRPDGTLLQIAVLPGDPSPAGQAAALREIARRAGDRQAGQAAASRPFRVDPLPGSIGFAEAWQLRERPVPGPLWALVGVGGDELAALGPDLGSGVPAFVVAGPPRSGRSGVLLVMARSLLAGEAQVVVVAPRPSPLRALAGEPGVLAVHTEEQLTADELAGLLDAAGSRPAVVLVDDAELLRGCDADRVLAELATGAAGPGRALALAGDSDQVCAGFAGWQVQARRARRGALLCPQTLADADLIGARLPRELLGRPVRPGLAVLHLGDGELHTVRVPQG